jgi:hypothetical protein
MSNVLKNALIEKMSKNPWVEYKINEGKFTENDMAYGAYAYEKEKYGEFKRVLTLSRYGHQGLFPKHGPVWYEKLGIAPPKEPLNVKPWPLDSFLEYIDISTDSNEFKTFIKDQIFSISMNNLAAQFPLKCYFWNNDVKIEGPHITFSVHLGKQSAIRNFICHCNPGLTVLYGNLSKCSIKPEIDPNEGKLIIFNQEKIEKQRTRELSNLQKFAKNQLIIYSNDQSQNFNTQLKFVYELSSLYYFHCSLEELDSFKLSGFYTIQSLFITHIYRNIQKRNKKEPERKIKIIIVIYGHEKHSIWKKINKKYLHYIEKKFEEAWCNALEYLSLSKKDLPFLKKDVINVCYGATNEGATGAYKHWKYFTSIMPDFDYPWNLYQDQTNQIQYSIPTIELDFSNYSMIISRAWISSRSIDFVHVGKKDIPENRWTKELFSRYLIENFFDKIVFGSMINLLKKWYSMTEKGIYIKNINQNLMYLIENIQKKVLELGGKIKNLDNKKPYLFTIGKYFNKKEVLLINHYSKKAWAFFERHLKKIWFFQIRMLQYKCSVIFKEKILKLFLQEPLHWETGNNNAIKECEELFMKSGADFEIPLINKTLYFAKNELINALRDYSVELKESPARELNALDKIEKNINRSKSKSKQMIVGFALTTAVRLPGYGNFQLVSSYAHGPHVFNFSCINDKSTLENETKGYVKPVRIQPSLNFDIRL